MKKLYQGKGQRVHPAPPPPASPDAALALALLPAALMALAAALTAEEQEVLAYLLSGIGTGGGSGGAGGGAGRRRRQSGLHQPEMGCGCFGCYKSFWARWDASPNRHLIHRIIEAVEEGTGSQDGGPAGGAGATRRGHRRRRRGRGGRDLDAAASDAVEAGDACVVDLQLCSASDGGEDGDYEGDGADSVYGGEGEETMMDDSDCASSAAAAEKSTVGKLVRFIGEKVWGPWT